jgi:hypothetical protein
MACARACTLHLALAGTPPAGMGKSTWRAGKHRKPYARTIQRPTFPDGYNTKKTNKERKQRLTTTRKGLEKIVKKRVMRLLAYILIA